MSGLAPIVVFVYNKFEDTKRMLDALVNNSLATESDLFIFSDGPKNAAASDGVERVRELVRSEDIKNAFKKVSVIEAEKNKGLAKSVITGVSKVIAEYGKVIVVEDDLVTSPCFLDYMNRALDYYASDDSIWSVTGFSYNMDIPKDYNHDVFVHGRGCSLGWGTWKDRWETVDWEVKTYPAFKHNWFKRYQVAKWGPEMPAMLDAQMYKGIDSWAIRWCYSAIIQKKMTVYPVRSKVHLVDESQSSTHGKVPESMVNIEIDKNVNCVDKMETVPVNRQVVKSFNKFGHGRSIKNTIRWFLIRITKW